MIKTIEDIRFHDNELVVFEKDMRGKQESKNVLDFSPKELYDIILQAYELGDRDARRRITDALAGRT
jgi:hypothetical protein